MRHGRLHIASVLIGWWTIAVSVAFAEPSVSNRQPTAGEIGYRPADGATVRLNPPSFIWLHEEAASRYTIAWSRNEDFSGGESAEDFVWNTYTHNRPFEPGTYYWRYRFTTAKGEQSGWSLVRRVVVPDSATVFTMPTRAEQKQRVPQAHPRLFLRPEDLPRLRGLAEGQLSAQFNTLRKEADRILQAGPTPEPEHLGSARDKENRELIKYWWSNREQTERACREAETLAFVYLLTQDRKYGEAARRWVLHLASWDPDGPTNFQLNCEAGKPMLYRPARAYDWAHDMFSAEDRAKIHAITVRRIGDAWKSGEVRQGVGHLNSPYSSHGNRVWHKIGEAGIAFLGEVPDAETWLDYAVNKFFGCYPVWADDDGGWHEGVSYWSGYMSKSVWWLQIAQSALGIDGLKKPFFAQVGDYPLYIAPPGSPNCGFGDLSYRPPSGGVGSWLEYHLRVKSQQPDGDHAGYWRWWTQEWGMQGQEGILGFLYAANLPPLPAAKPPTDLPQSKVFHGIGVASLHSTLLDSSRDVHFLFKSSPFGTQSHGHNPHNTFQLNAYGEALLTTCVYRDLHGSKFHYQWAHSTVAHNGVLVNGEGQIKHTNAPHGRIVLSVLGDEADYIVGDATLAYGDRLEKYYRHALLVKGPQKTPLPFVVVVDDLAARNAATFQFMLHALRQFTINEGAGRLSAEQPKAGIDVQYLSPLPLSYRQWDGYDPPPTKEFPNQWHVEASTREKQKEVAVVSVLVPYRAGQRPDWSAVRDDNDTHFIVRVKLDDSVSTISIPKSIDKGMKPVIAASGAGRAETSE